MYIKGCENSTIHSTEEENSNFHNNFKTILFERTEWDEDKKAFVGVDEYWSNHEQPSRRHYIYDEELGKSILEAEYIKRHGKTTRKEDKGMLLTKDNVFYSYEDVVRVNDKTGERYVTKEYQKTIGVEVKRQTRKDGTQTRYEHKKVSF